jgi:hypothetical protein
MQVPEEWPFSYFHPVFLVILRKSLLFISVLLRDDRRGAAKELHDLLESLGVSVWFSE